MKTQLIIKKWGQTSPISLLNKSLYFKSLEIERGEKTHLHHLTPSRQITRFKHTSFENSMVLKRIIGKISWTESSKNLTDKGVGIHLRREEIPEVWGSLNSDYGSHVSRTQQQQQSEHEKTCYYLLILG